MQVAKLLVCLLKEEAFPAAKVSIKDDTFELEWAREEVWVVISPDGSASGVVRHENGVHHFAGISSIKELIEKIRPAFRMKELELTEETIKVLNRTIIKFYGQRTTPAAVLNRLAKLSKAEDDAKGPEYYYGSIEDAFELIGEGMAMEGLLEKEDFIKKEN